MNCEHWAWEKDLGFDDEGYQRKEMCCAIGECPVCGKDVELVADTESWTEGDDGRWIHSEYGPAQGVCCERLIVDSWDGCFMYDLSRTAADDCTPDDEDDWEDDYDGDW